jgi:hypothetical protein
MEMNLQIERLHRDDPENIKDRKRGVLSLSLSLSISLSATNLFSTHHYAKTNHYARLGRLKDFLEREAGDTRR